MLLIAIILTLVSAAPKPTLPQLNWQKGEIMALIHFNMATFFKNGDPGCDASNWIGETGSSNPASFSPTQLNTTQWVDSMLALGATEAVLTAKHGCGFYLWPTNVTLPNGTLYPYHVDIAKYGDVLRQFVDSTTSAGIGHGFYYSLTNNFFLNVLGHEVQNTTLLPGQVGVTQQEFEDIAFNSVSELWTQYGNLTEIWFDGGYTSDMEARLQALLQSAQPDAVAFGGEGISSNPARWCGTEDGDPPGWPTIWSTGSEGPGVMPNSSGAVWNPSGVDFTLQVGDVWFFEPGNPVHMLADLISVYQRSVGANGKLELDFAIDRTGQVNPVHATRYAQFGDWIRSCYGTPVASTIPAAGVWTILLALPPGGASVDRVMLREDQSEGESVVSYTVFYQVQNGTFFPFSSGMSIGNKRIDVNPGGAVFAINLLLNISAAFAPLIPSVNYFAAFDPVPCALPTTKVRFQYQGGGCLTTNSTGYPCPGGAGNSCPAFLGSCADPTSVWDDSSGILSNVRYGSDSAINIDCNSGTPHAVAKCLYVPGGGSGNPIAFSAASNGQLVYTSNSGSTLCLNGGQGPVTPPCNSAENFIATQVNIDLCSNPSTTGWTRILAE